MRNETGVNQGGLKKKKKMKLELQEKKKITTPGVPRLSPTLVLTRPEEA